MTAPAPPPGPEDTWPTRADTTIVASRGAVAPAPPPPEPAGPPDRRIGAGMLLGLGALALVAIGILVAYLLTHRSSPSTTTTVVVTSAPATKAPTGFVVAPDVRGLPFAAARSQLVAAGLTPAESTAISSRKPGTVLRETPRAGARARKGSTVTLVVATAGTGTTPATSTAAATTSPATTTAATTTAAAAPSTPTSATVPDVGGRTEQAAADALSSAGVLPSIFFVPASDPLGTIEQQAKPAGTVVPYRSHVQLNVSKGPHATTDVTVPNTIGKSLTEAVATLNGAGLRLIYVKLQVTSRAQAGTIAQQSPLAGGKAPRNAQVLVFLGAYRGT